MSLATEGEEEGEGKDPKLPQIVRLLDSSRLYWILLDSSWINWILLKNPIIQVFGAIWGPAQLFTCKVFFEAQSIFSQDIHKRTLTIQLGTKLTACVVLFFFFKWTKSLRNYKQRERESLSKELMLIFPL